MDRVQAWAVDLAQDRALADLAQAQVADLVVALAAAVASIFY